MIAGGMENMSLVPMYFPRGHNYGNVVVQDGVLLDGLTDVYDGIHMGLCAENTAEREGFSREDQDAYAIESYPSPVQTPLSPTLLSPALLWC